MRGMRDEWLVRPSSMFDYRTLWAFSLVKRDDPYNPSAIYAYKVVDPETGWEGWILALYPRGCGESGCAYYIHTEATDEDALETAEWLARLYDRYYYFDPETFWDEVHSADMVVLEPGELDRYEFIQPSPELLSKVLAVGRMMKA